MIRSCGIFLFDLRVAFSLINPATNVWMLIKPYSVQFPPWLFWCRGLCEESSLRLTTERLWWFKVFLIEIFAGFLHLNSTRPRVEFRKLGSVLECSCREEVYFQGITVIYDQYSLNSDLFSLHGNVLFHVRRLSKYLHLCGIDRPFSATVGHTISECHIYWLLFFMFSSIVGPDQGYPLNIRY